MMLLISSRSLENIGLMRKKQLRCSHGSLFASCLLTRGQEWLVGCSCGVAMLALLRHQKKRHPRESVSAGMTVSRLLAERLRRRKDLTLFRHALATCFVQAHAGGDRNVQALNRTEHRD